MWGDSLEGEELAWAPEEGHRPAGGGCGASGPASWCDGVAGGREVTGTGTGCCMPGTEGRRGWAQGTADPRHHSSAHWGVPGGRGGISSVSPLLPHSSAPEDDPRVFL